MMNTDQGTMYDACRRDLEAWIATDPTEARIDAVVLCQADRLDLLGDLLGWRAGGSRRSP